LKDLTQNSARNEGNCLYVWLMLCYLHIPVPGMSDVTYTADTIWPRQGLFPFFIHYDNPGCGAIRKTMSGVTLEKGKLGEGGPLTSETKQALS